MIVQTNGFVYVYGTYSGNNAVLGEFSAGGTNRFWDYRKLGPAENGTGIFFDRLTGKVMLTGGGFRPIGLSSYTSEAFLISFDTNLNEQPNKIWSYYGAERTSTQGLDMAQNSRGETYITGYVPNEGDASKAMFLARISNLGQQLGLDRYNSPNPGSNYGTSLVIDTNDNVYVTGYLQNTQGGSEIVTVKYSAAPKIAGTASGAMHLEFHASPGQPYSIETTTDFFAWQSLITNTADASGLIQFDDTNAVAVPYRFYRGNSAP